jgi:hypothetical protein
MPTKKAQVQLATGKKPSAWRLWTTLCLNIVSDYIKKQHVDSESASEIRKQVMSAASDIYKKFQHQIRKQHPKYNDAQVSHYIQSTLKHKQATTIIRGQLYKSLDLE